MAKVSQRSVHYELVTLVPLATGRDERCGTCSMFRPRGPLAASCTLVNSRPFPIVRVGRCQRYSPLRAAHQ
jgi:hypothetical protein